VWRRALTRSCSHYLQPLLGKDGPGSVMLTGGHCHFGVYLCMIHYS
jgi:hypothetical protein